MLLGTGICEPNQKAVSCFILALRGVCFCPVQLLSASAERKMGTGSDLALGNGDVKHPPCWGGCLEVQFTSLVLFSAKLESSRPATVTIFLIFFFFNTFLGLGRFCLVEILCLQEFRGGQFASAPILILQELNCKATRVVSELLLESLVLQG